MPLTSKMRAPVWMPMRPVSSACIPAVSISEMRELKQIREPASLVHNDYTPNSGFTCLRENLGDDAEFLARARFQIINVWRPLVDPVEDYPLALCDARSVNPLDLIDSERRAQTTGVKFN
ncbi:MAG: hypothetical protein GY770_23110 [Aestuariibacter sp.]|nr:hypothetical protein [Aestuariibacter sp.]